MAMCDRIEKVHGRSWVEVVGSKRKFSECMIYGRYVDEVLEAPAISTVRKSSAASTGPARRCRTTSSARFVAAMAPQQVAIGMQSFIGTDIGRIRRLIGRAKPQIAFAGLRIAE